MVFIRPGSGFGIDPSIRTAGGVRVGAPRSAAREIARSDRGEGSLQRDPFTGRILGRLIVPGTERSQVVRRNTQDDLFAQILGGQGRDFFPKIDPATGINISKDFRTLRPEQILALRGGGGAFADDPSVRRSSPLFPAGGGLFQGGDTAEAAANGPALPMPVLLLAGAAVLLLVLAR